ncbi:STAS domain-containing protein [Undibacterium sp. TJN25]|uniref:STAS domain-containing protein n=1 Tax=Undibacterium sp. TJN25 TaxID=3413056 RepID=UPI003BF42C93
MPTSTAGNISDLIRTNEEQIREEWVQNLKGNATRGDADGNEVRRQCSQFLTVLSTAAQNDPAGNLNTAAWDETRHVLADMSASRAKQGASPGETAMFVFSLKQVLFDRLVADFKEDPAVIAASTLKITAVLDKLGLFTMEAFQKTRDQIIVRQQQELLELSTPVVKLWENVLALPLIGTLDSARTQVVMESLLQKIVETGAAIAIIDITGVPTVDTLVAQHLMKTIAAARLMGADCIISGIRPQIAQTIVHLGVNLEDVVTKATLADAFLVALKRTGASIINTKE